MSLYLTSDTHFGHRNIIGYCNRPYTDVDEMDEALVERWNDTVRPTDEIWHLGDVAMGELEQTLQIVRRLHGRKYLVPGNHDRCWTGLTRHHEWTDFYTGLGFTLLPGQTTLQVGGVEALVCHFPYRDPSLVQERYAKHRPIDEGQWLLHGHVHDEWQRRGRMTNVGVDVWDQRPVHLDEAQALLRGNAGSTDAPSSRPRSAAVGSRVWGS